MYAKLSPLATSTTQRGRPRPPHPPSAALIWSVLLSVVTFGLCFVPLFNLLGYESSLALGLLGSLCSAQLAATVIAAERRAQPAEAAALAEQRPLRALLLAYLRGLGWSLAALVGPLVLLVGNGVRVRNCDYLAGLSFFFMIPACSAACGAALGALAGLFARGRWRATLLAWGLVLLSLLWAGARFLRSPAISAYDPFFGYFPGALYDEEVTVLRPFYLARLVHGLWVAGALLLGAALLRGEGLGLRRPPRARWRVLAAAGVLLAAAGALQANLGRLGVYHDVASVERALSRERRTAHFVLRYAPGGAVARDIELYAREHELRYRQLREALGVEPQWPEGGLRRWLLAITAPRGAVVSYLFDSAQRKRELMGASNTYIAKPWRREIYLQHEGWPHPVLKHELAHVFLGAAGDPLLRVSLRGLVPHQGMIEGLAVAVEWRGGGRLSPHQAARAMRDTGLLPPLAQVFGLSFLTVSAGRAYTVAGSFCRYLLDRFGPGPLLEVYRRGGSPEAFAAALGEPFPQLESGWKALIDRQPLEAPDREVERERVRRPAVFYKVCAHELALRRQEASAALSRGEQEEAERLLESICKEDPAEPRHLADLMDFYFGMGAQAQAARTAERLLARLGDGPSLSPVLAGRAEALLGDLAWIDGRGEEAARRWRAAQRRPGDEGSARLLTAKLLALEGAAGAGELLLRVLVGEPRRLWLGERAPERDGALDLVYLMRATAQAPELGLAHYLLGRQLYARGGFSDAAAALGDALARGLPDARFALQAGRMRGQALLRARRHDEARLAFEAQLQALGPEREGERMDLRDWLERNAAWPSLP